MRILSTYFIQQCNVLASHMTELVISPLSDKAYLSRVAYLDCARIPLSAECSI